MVNEFVLREKLNDVMVPGISILAVKKLEEKSQNCMASVFAAEYSVSFSEDLCLPENFKESVIDYFGQLTIPVNKPKKKGGGFVSMDLKQFIYDYSSGNRSISFTVNASSSDNIKPSFVVESLFDYLNLNISETEYFVKRVEIFGNNSKDGINLVSLLDI